MIGHTMNDSLDSSGTVLNGRPKKSAKLLNEIGNLPVDGRLISRPCSDSRFLVLRLVEGEARPSERAAIKQRLQYPTTIGKDQAWTRFSVSATVSTLIYYVAVCPNYG